MSDANKAVVRDYIAAAAVQDWDATDRFHAQGWTQINPDGRTATTDTYKAEVAVFFSGFPDLAPTIHEQIAEGDTVVTRLTWAGTHTGDFMGMPATGKHVDFDVVRIDRVAGGQIAETRVVFDRAAAMEQLGMGPG